MNAATILTVLSIVSDLIAVAKDAPAVIVEAKSLLDKVAPHVGDANSAVQERFEHVREELAKLEAA